MAIRKVGCNFEFPAFVHTARISVAKVTPPSFTLFKDSATSISLPFSLCLFDTERGWASFRSSTSKLLVKVANSRSGVLPVQRRALFRYTLYLLQHFSSTIKAS